MANINHIFIFLYTETDFVHEQRHIFYTDGWEERRERCTQRYISKCVCKGARRQTACDLGSSVFSVQQEMRTCWVLEKWWSSHLLSCDRSLFAKDQHRVRESRCLWSSNWKNACVLIYLFNYTLSLLKIIKMSYKFNNEIKNMLAKHWTLYGEHSAKLYVCVSVSVYVYTHYLISLSTHLTLPFYNWRN